MQPLRAFEVGAVRDFHERDECGILQAFSALAVELPDTNSQKAQRFSSTTYARCPQDKQSL